MGQARRVAARQKYETWFGILLYKNTPEDTDEYALVHK